MKNLVPSCLFASFIKVSSLFKMSFVVGSQMIWLSGASVLAPLSGAFGGLNATFFVFVARLMIHFLFLFLHLVLQYWCVSSSSS